MEIPILMHLGLDCLSRKDPRATLEQPTNILVSIFDQWIKQTNSALSDLEAKQRFMVYWLVSKTKSWVKPPMNCSSIDQVCA